LQSGQTVEVITAPGAQPSPAWLNFVVSARARTAIRHFLKHSRKTESLALGKRMLDRALNSLDSSLDRISDEQKQRFLRNTGVEQFDRVLEEIGLGNRVSFITARQLLSRADDAANTSAQEPLVIHGTEGFLINFAKCCHPIPGDPIVGLISSEKGMVVHAESCHNSAEMRDKPERMVPLRWAEDVDGEFSCELRIDLEKSRGAIAVLATRITSTDATIKRITVDDDDPRLSVVRLIIGVTNRIHLAHVMKRVRTIKGVAKVARIRH
jgi:guanosine-3',5'-bis(diphosphate) 3'-pyrophosphohydrolase